MINIGWAGQPDLDLLDRAAAQCLHCVYEPPPVDADRIHRVARIDGQLVGCCALAGTSAGLQVLYLHVFERWRRRGVGRALVDDARHTAARRGCHHIDVSAHPHHEAFYLATGAWRIGTTAAGPVVRWARPLLRVPAASPSVSPVGADRAAGPPNGAVSGNWLVATL